MNRLKNWLIAGLLSLGGVLLLILQARTRKQAMQEAKQLSDQQKRSKEALGNYATKKQDINEAKQTAQQQIKEAKEEDNEDKAKLATSAALNSLRQRQRQRN